MRGKSMNVRSLGLGFGDGLGLWLLADICSGNLLSGDESGLWLNGLGLPDGGVKNRDRVT